MDPHLARLRLRYWLEHQARQCVAALAEVYPAVLRRARLATEQCAPELRHADWVDAVDGHARPHVRHVGHPTTPRPGESGRYARDVEPDNPGQDQPDRDQLERGRGFAEHKDAYNRRAGGADSRPHRVG